MDALSLGKIAEFAGADLFGGNAETQVQRVSTDSRTIRDGDLFVAFSTANPHAADSDSPTREIETMPNDLMDPLLTATVEATEEAIVNALIDNHDMVGRDNHRVEALPHERLRELLKQRNVLR